MIKRAFHGRTILDPGCLYILWPGPCQFDVKFMNQKPVNKFSQSFTHMLTGLLERIWGKKILKEPPELNINYGSSIHKLRRAYNFFVISGHFYALHRLEIGLELVLGPGLLINTLAQVVSIWDEVRKSEIGQHIYKKVCPHFHKPFSTHVSKKKKNQNNSQRTSRIEHKPRLAYNFFANLGYFDAMHGKKVKAR